MKLCCLGCGILLTLLCTRDALPAPGGSSKEVTDRRRSVPFPVCLPVNYEVDGADFLFLKEASQDLMRNSSTQTDTQALVLLTSSRQPTITGSYGSRSTRRSVPFGLLKSARLFDAPEIVTFNWTVQAFVLTPQVFSSKPRVRVLFYVAGREWDRGPRTRDGAVHQLPCVTVYAFWQTQEVRTSCAMGGERGTCTAELLLAPSWFAPGNKQEPPAGNSVELYYQARPKVDGRCNSPNDSHWSFTRQQQEEEYVPVMSMQRISSVRLLQVPKGMATLSRLKLGNAILIRTSSKPLKTKDVATFDILTTGNVRLTNFTLRASVGKGLTFVTAAASVSGLWTITTVAGPQEVSLMCQSRTPTGGQRPNVGLQEVLQLNFMVEEPSFPLDHQVILWKLDLPNANRNGSKTEGPMRLYVTQRDFVGLAPLVVDTEIVNTAVLTGKKVVMPVRVVAVDEGGGITDVTEYSDCSSANEDVLKVSDRCDHVYVDGRETKGRVKTLVTFNYSFLSAQLELTVWIPQLPLIIEVSDTELSQIKSWRVPIVSSKRPVWTSGEDDRKGKGCTLQFQHALVRVLTHFVAEQADPRDPVVYFLGSDWQVDVSRMVRYFIKVEDPGVARLKGGRVLLGQDLGTTSVQVFSPLSDGVLAKTTIKVVDDKVTITELSVQLVPGLSMTLQLSPGSDRAILATTTAQEFLPSRKQEALLSVWLHFSDGSHTPLDIYDPASYKLNGTSSDPEVVTVKGRSPVVVAEGEGGGALVQLEMSICDACQKSKRRTTIAAGNGSLMVKLQQNVRWSGLERNNTARKNNSSYYGNDKEKEPGKAPPAMEGKNAPQTTATSVRSVVTSGSLGGVGKNLAVPRSTVNVSLTGGGPMGPGDTVVEDVKTTGPVSTARAQGNLVDSNDQEAETEEPEQKTKVDEDEDEDEVSPYRPLTDLELGMYTLLAVFCLAILVFLLNCLTHLVKFRHRKPPTHGLEPPGHRHNWVWLGTDAELVMNVPGSPVHREPQVIATSVIDIGPDKSGPGSRRHSCLSSDANSPTVRTLPTEALNSPTSRRKRVQFTTFSTAADHKQLSQENGHCVDWGDGQDQGPETGEQL